jgi:hypothetical protein
MEDGPLARIYRIQHTLKGVDSYGRYVRKTGKEIAGLRAEIVAIARDLKLYKALRIKDGHLVAPYQFTDYEEFILSGRWTPNTRTPLICARGWHLTDRPIAFIKGTSGPWSFEERRNHRYWAIYLAEGRGDYATDYNKIAFQSIRLVKRIDNWEGLQ